ncbi:MAG: competence/damage-inducible protein A [Bacteroidota bacterium]
MKSSIITIGDEILIGQIVDTNSAWIATQLNNLGIGVDRIFSIADTLDAIQNNLDLAWKTSDIILLTGGLGPTKDDVTKKALAEYFDTDLVFHQETYDRIVYAFEKRRIPLTEYQRFQCELPESAELLRNDLGTAPGMWFERSGKIVVSMPGVPHEMKHLMEARILPRLEKMLGSEKLIHKTIRTAGMGETSIAKRIEHIETSLPEHIKLAYLPSLGHVRLRLSGRSDQPELLQKEIDYYASGIEKAIPELIYGYGNTTLQEYIGQVLAERGLTLGTAESCSGGFIAHTITSVPGSSAYFQGSIISYSNAIKVAQLGVQEATLEAYGAVSEQTVAEMAKGAVERLGVDFAIATSGIAGPGGGTPEKPVGLIWTAVASKDRVVTREFRLGKKRLTNIQRTTIYTLNMLRKFLLDSDFA